MNALPAQVISLWPFPNENMKREVIVVQTHDLEDLKYYVGCGDVPKPKHVFCLAPAASSEAETLLYWLKYEKFPAFEVEPNDTQTGAFFRTWEAICKNPWAFPRKLVDSTLQNPPRGLRNTIPSFGFIFDFLTYSFIEPLDMLISNGGPYIDYSPFAKNRVWWRRAPDMLGELQARVAGLERFETHGSFFSVGRTHLQALLDFVSGLHAHKTETSLDAAAGLCLVLGQVMLQLSQNSAAIIFHHRVLDYFLQARCQEHNLLTETGLGFQFSNHSFDTKITALNCYNELISQQKYLSKQKVTASLRACNEIRNNLILTHSIFGASPAYTLRYADTICQCIEGVDPSAAKRVLAYRENFVKCSTIDPALIFCLDKDLRNCLHPASVS